MPSTPIVRVVPAGPAVPVIEAPRLRGLRGRNADEKCHRGQGAKDELHGRYLLNFAFCPGNTLGGLNIPDANKASALPYPEGKRGCSGLRLGCRGLAQTVD